MLITDRFVMLNFPKTGSSFAREVLKELHAPKGFRRFLSTFVKLDTGLEEVLVIPYRFQPSAHAYPSQHGVYVQIPPAHRDKQVMSIIRDPLDRLISAYEFKHWSRHVGDRVIELRERFPNFPDLSFEEFLTYHFDVKAPGSMPDGMQVDIGPFTLQFIRFFAHDPLRTMRSLHEGMDLASVRDEHFIPVRLLHMESLRDELTAFLSDMGYDKERLSFIKDKARVNTTGRTRPNYITPAVEQQVRHAERFVYQLLPEYLTRPN